MKIKITHIAKPSRGQVAIAAVCTDAETYNAVHFNVPSTVPEAQSALALEVGAVYDMSISFTAVPET